MGAIFSRNGCCLGLIWWEHARVSGRVLVRCQHPKAFQFRQKRTIEKYFRRSAHLAVLDHAQADCILAQANKAARAVNRVQHPVPPCAAALRASCVYELQHLRVPRRIGSDMH